MQQFIDKLISRIREEKDKDRSNIYSASQCDTLRFAYGHTIDIVNQLAEEYKGGWIPVSERLPENDENVLVWFEYFRFGEYNRLYQTYGISHTFRGEWSGFVNGESGWRQLRIIAWQPLPSPYQKEGELI